MSSRTRHGTLVLILLLNVEENGWRKVSSVLCHHLEVSFHPTTSELEMKAYLSGID